LRNAKVEAAVRTDSGNVIPTPDYHDPFRQDIRRTDKFGIFHSHRAGRFDPGLGIIDGDNQ
jgi:hypothetical protein